MFSYGKFKRWSGVLVALGIASLAVLTFCAKQLLYIETTLKDPDAIVILGGDAGDRAFRCLEVFRTNTANQIFISGTNDCYLIRSRLAMAGVPMYKLLMEPDSQNTKENAEFTIKLLRQHGCKKVIIVTSWYHSRRAMACFKHFSKDIEFASLPAYHGVNMKDKPSRGETAFVFHEYIGLLWYAIRYGITPC